MPKQVTYAKKPYKKMPYKAKPTKASSTSWLIKNQQLNKKGEGVYTYERTVSNNFRDVDNPSYTGQIQIDNGFHAGYTMNGFNGSVLNIYNKGLASVNLDLYNNSGTLLNTLILDVPSVSEFVALYKFYRINWMEIEFIYSSISVPVTSTSSQLVGTPYIGFAKDYADNGYRPVTGLEQYGNYDIWQPGTDFNGNGRKKIYLKPACLNQMTSSTGTSNGNAESKFGQWLSTNTAIQCEHYGLKTSIVSFGGENTTPTPLGYLGVKFKLNMSFKDVN